MFNSEKDDPLVNSIKKYLHSHNGIYPPYQYIDDEGNRIGSWIMTKYTRLKIGSVEDDEINYLKKTELDFGIELLTWNEWFEKLKKYFEENKTDHITSEVVINKEYRLGQWAKRQVNHYTALTEDRKSMLCSLKWDDITKKIKPIKCEYHTKDKYTQSQQKHQIVKDATLLNRKYEKELHDSIRIKDPKVRKQLEQQAKKILEDDLKIKADLKLTIFKSKDTTFSGGSKGSIIYASIENESDRCMDIEVVDFSLMQGKKNIKFDFYLFGYFNQKTTLLPRSTRTTARMYYSWNLNNFKLNHMDTVDITVKDIILNVFYSAKFKYLSDKDENGEWVCTYHKANQISGNDNYIENKLMKYRKWVQKQLISENDYKKIKNKMLELQFEGGCNYE